MSFFQNQSRKFMDKGCIISVLQVAKGQAVAYWLRHYATSRKVEGSRPVEVNEFLQFT
jgi:hypothetical protein